MAPITPSTRKTTYNPVTPTTAFPVNFPIADNSDLKVTVDGATRTDFTVASTYPDGLSYDAVVNMNTAVTGAVIIYGKRIPRRQNQFQTGRPLPIPDLNASLNTLEIESQEARRDIDELRDDLTAEISDREDAEAALGVRIDTETSARIAGDLAVNARVDQEIVDRGLADNALKSLIAQGGEIEAPVFESRLAVGFATIKPTISFILIGGQVAAGDSNTESFQRVPSEPDVDDKLQAGDGSWWQKVLPTTFGFFKDDDPSTVINRFRDRLFVGDGAKHTGRRTAPLGGSWLTEEGANYFEKNALASMLTVRSEQRAALLVGSYTPAGVAAMNNGGLFAVTMHKGTTGNGRAVYAEAFHYATGGGTTEGIEVQVGNYTGVMPNQPTAYNPIGGAMGQSWAVEGGNAYVLGDDNTPLPPPTVPATLALRVAGGVLATSNPAYRWRAGLTFMDNAIWRGSDGINGIAVAIGLAKQHQIEWRVSHTVMGAKIRSDVASANRDMGLIFTDGRADVVGSGEVPVTGFAFDLIGTPVNRTVFRNARTGVNPRWSAEGSDTNIGLDIEAKGTGSIRFHSHDTAGENLRIVPPSSAPTDFLTVTGSANGGVANIGAGGASANIDIVLNPKGTGNVRFGTVTSSADAPVTGYITIKDSAGATRKLAVIA